MGEQNIFKLTERQTREKTVDKAFEPPWALANFITESLKPNGTLSAKLICTQRDNEDDEETVAYVFGPTSEAQIKTAQLIVDAVNATVAQPEPLTAGERDRCWQQIEEWQDMASHPRMRISDAKKDVLIAERTEGVNDALRLAGAALEAIVGKRGENDD